MQLVRANARFLHRAFRTDEASVAAVLNLGVGVVLLDQMTQCMMDSLTPLLDEGVLDRLAADEQDLSENLDHLDSLSATDPHSPDVNALAGALIERIRAHLERKDRVIYRPLKLLDSLAGGNETEEHSL